MERKHLEMALAVLSIAFMVYATLIIRLLHVVNTKLISSTTSIAPSPPLLANGRVLLFGHYVPLWLVCVLGSAIPTWDLASWIRRKILLRHRRRYGLCLDCGYPLPTRRGKCPSCGVRYEVEQRGRIVYGFSVIQRKSNGHHHRCKPSLLPISWS
jgi:hypothetical protein